LNDNSLWLRSTRKLGQRKGDFFLYLFFTCDHFVNGNGLATLFATAKGGNVNDYFPSFPVASSALFCQIRAEDEPGGGEKLDSLLIVI